MSPIERISAARRPSRARRGVSQHAAENRRRVRREPARRAHGVLPRRSASTDVTTHPVISVAVEHAAIDYRLAEDPRHRALCVVSDGDGEYSRYYQIPRTRRRPAASAARSSSWRPPRAERWSC